MKTSSSIGEIDGRLEAHQQFPEVFMVSTHQHVQRLMSISGDSSTRNRCDALDDDFTIVVDEILNVGQWSVAGIVSQQAPWGAVRPEAKPRRINDLLSLHFSGDRCHQSRG